jgi:peptidoglycan/xylan/chitin deacetylase (PgdA/CDA1 family)
LKKPTVEELTDFTLDSYVSLLKYLSQIYTIAPFCRISRKFRPYLILRHDVDYSLETALEMARLERSLGIKSTYFVLASGEVYDLFEERNALCLKEISSLGHEIGLHFEPEKYRSYKRSIYETFRIEVQRLETLSGKRVYSIARHNSWDRDPFASVKGYINANHPFWRCDLFVHDSCRAWATVEGLSMLLNNPPPTVQLLVHPDNWRKDEIDREALIEDLFQGLNRKNTALKQRMKKTWLNDPLVLEYESAIKNKKLTSAIDESLFSPSSPEGGLKKKLAYYKKTVTWHLINSELGWMIHQGLDQIRHATKKSGI